MQAYRVQGSFPNGKNIQEFTMDVVASDEADARHRVESNFGSRHRVFRRFVNIESIEVIDPSDSREPKVISAFRGDTSSPAAVASESSAASEEE
jgi:ribosomal protein L20A (L18A)